MEQQVKLVPYGVADFATVIEQNLYYVDKTMFIPELEKQPRNLFLNRPRRFGKSIFLSMLYSYYDCTQSHKFQSLFGNLWIGQHPTPLQGKYQVLFLDFSQITGNIDKLETKFNSYLSINLDAFVRQYSEYYQAEMEEILAQEDFEEKMELIFKAAKRTSIICISSSMSMTTSRMSYSTNVVRMCIMRLPMPTAFIVMSSRSSRVILSVSS